MKQFSIFVFLLTILSACTKNSPYPIIDIHSHASLEAGTATLSDLTSAMDSSNVSHMLILREPNAIYRATDTMTTTLSFFAAETRFKFMYGGHDLNPIVHALGREGASTITSADIYPSGDGGIGSAQDITDFQNIAKDPTTWEATFKSLATAAADSGSYVGFGEFAPYHFSRKEGQPYVIFSANHSLMKWISDLAASRNMVLDIHIEIDDTKLAEFKDFLSHNTNTKVIWDHTGWSNTGDADAKAVGELMDAYPNLYLSLKLRVPDSNEMRESLIFDSRGKIRRSWAKLLESYRTRTMVGIDTKYFSDKSASTLTSQAVTAYSQLMLQLPKTTAQEISSGTAKRLLGF